MPLPTCCIHVCAGIPVHQQVLCFAGQHLKDHLSLVEHGLEEYTLSDEVRAPRRAAGRAHCWGTCSPPHYGQAGYSNNTRSLWTWTLGLDTGLTHYYLTPAGGPVLIQETSPAKAHLSHITDQADTEGGRWS